MSRWHPQKIALLCIVLFAATAATPLFGSVATRVSSEETTATQTRPTITRAAETALETNIEPVESTSAPASQTNSASHEAASIPEESPDATQSDTPKEEPVQEQASTPTPDDVVQEESVEHIEIQETEELADPIHIESDDPVPDGVPEDTPNTRDEQKFLTLHNEVRDEHDLPPFSWSDDLARDAAVWAETLTNDNCELRHSDEPYGENLFSLWTNDPTAGGTPEEAMDWWAGEEKLYDYESNTCASGEICGHYTQIVWEDTTHVGCARTQCTDAEGTTDLFVCRYSPQGNIPGMRPY